LFNSRSAVALNGAPASCAKGNYGTTLANGPWSAVSSFPLDPLISS
jgi:hypothetical protein